MNADGTGARRIAEELDVRGAPTWSPDGKWLAVAANRDGEPQLFKIPVGSGTPVLLVKDYSLDPIWAPSGQFLVYSGADVGTNFSVKAVSADGVPRPLPNLILTRGARRLAFLGGDNALVIMKSPSGVPAVYQATWTEWKGYRFYVEAYGELGMVRGYYAPMFNLLVTQDRPGGRRRRTYKLYPEIIVREKLKTWTSTALQSFQDELTGFRDMIDGRPAALADGFAGLRAVEIAHAIYQSSASGQPVRLPPR